MIKYEKLSALTALYMIKDKNIKKEIDRIYYKNATKYSSVFNNEYKKIKNLSDSLLLEEDDYFRKIYGVFLSNEKELILNLMSTNFKNLVNLVKNTKNLESIDFVKKFLNLKTIKNLIDFRTLDNFTENFTIFCFISLVLENPIKEDIFLITFYKWVEEEYNKRNSIITYNSKNINIIKKEEYIKSILKMIYNNDMQNEKIEKLYTNINIKTNILSKLFQTMGLYEYVKEINNINYNNSVKYLTNIFSIINDFSIEIEEDIDFQVEEIFVWISISNFIDIISKNIKKNKDYHFSKNKKLINKKEVEETFKENKKINKELENLNNKIDKISRENIKLKEDNKKLELFENKNLIDKEYQKKIRIYENQIKDLTNKRERDMLELYELRNFIFNLNNEEEDNNTSIIFNYDNFKDYKIIVAGGLQTWINEIKYKLPKAIFLSKDNLNFDTNVFIEADLVIFNIRGMSHALYYKIINELRKRKIKPKYINNENELKNTLINHFKI